MCSGYQISFTWEPKKRAYKPRGRGLAVSFSTKWVKAKWTWQRLTLLEFCCGCTNFSPQPPKSEAAEDSHIPRGKRQDEVTGVRGWLKWCPDDFGFWLSPQNLIIRIESWRPGIPLQSSAPSMALGILVDRRSAVKWVQWVLVGGGGSVGLWVSGGA